MGIFFQNIASAGNRTRINCLEGSYADHYTTDADAWRGCKESLTEACVGELGVEGGRCTRKAFRATKSNHGTYQLSFVDQHTLCRCYDQTKFNTLEKSLKLTTQVQTRSGQAGKCGFSHVMDDFLRTEKSCRMNNHRLYSSVAERWSCKPKVMSSILIGGIFVAFI